MPVLEKGSLAKDGVFLLPTGCLLSVESYLVQGMCTCFYLDLVFKRKVLWRYILFKFFFLPFETFNANNIGIKKCQRHAKKQGIILYCVDTCKLEYYAV